MRLSDLLKGSKDDVTTGCDHADLEITGLTCDSRDVRPGFLFAALPGRSADGRAFIAEALSRGAGAVLAPIGTAMPDAPPGVSVPLVTDDNPRRRFALLAARFYGRQPECVAAVTGTNGKTSVVTFLRQIWAALGLPAASIGTLGASGPRMRLPGSLTTPDPVALHQMLARLADDDVSHLAIEASSHGLDQHRLDGVRVAVAAFTTLGRDHLDYHGSFEAYRDAKLRLFAELALDSGVGVINADDDHAAAFRAVAERRDLRVLTYGEAGADARIEACEAVAGGQILTVALHGVRRRLRLPLAGRFQAQNALCAALAATATGCDPAAVLDALEALEGVPGRMQHVARLDNGSAVYVDYAHTPDALETVLRALRPHAAKRLLVVFGCGGDRDAGKRPVMGRLAAELADHVIVTDDNPRTEDAATIRRQVMVGCPAAIEVGDRAEAISGAMSSLRAGDVLVVAGKGHESGQIVGDTVLPFDDAAAVRAAHRALRPNGRERR